MISRGKKRIVLVVAILVVSLVAVAIPLCAGAACAESKAASQPMPLHMSLLQGPQAVAKAACDIVIAAGSGLDSVMPAFDSNPLLPLVAGILAFLAITGLLFRWRRGGAAVVLARVLPTPYDPGGVRLLI